MKVKIEIDCETAGELRKHLNEIIRIIAIRSRQNDDHDFEVGTNFSDSNCYGSHEVIIE
jgi:hypothetical protein